MDTDGDLTRIAAMTSGRKPIALTLACIAAALTLAACGGSSTKSTASATQASTSQTSTTSTTTSAVPPTKKFEVSSPVVPASRAIPVRYTCDGSDTSLPLSWSNVPAGTKELALFIVSAGNPTGTYAHWGVTGLKPTLRGFPAGKLPPGAVVGRNSLGDTGYSLCPARGKFVEFAMALYALPNHLKVKAGFNTVSVLHKIEKNPNLALNILAYQRR
jgi:phosphatidylethanolamine-binding protein (PEBP) family uncharacterized protein